MGITSLQILLIEDDAGYSQSVRRALERAEQRFHVTVFESLAAARIWLAEHTPDLILAEEHLPDGSGLELLNGTLQAIPWPVVILLPRTSERRAVEVIKAGAIDYIIKSRKRLRDLPHTILHAHREWAHILEQRQAENALRESEKKYRTLAENINIGIFRTSVEEGGRIIYANQALAKTYGADSPEEMLNLHIADIYWNPEDRAAVLSDLFLKGQVQAYEILLKNKKGEPVWCSINAQLLYVPDGTPAWIDGTIENINERKRTEQALRENETLIRSIFENDPTGVCFTINRTFLRANRRFCEMIGYSEDELIGQSVRMAYPDDKEFDHAGRELYSGLEAYGIGTVETRLKRKDGTIIDVLISVAPLDPQNLSAGLTTVVLDVTERNRAEALRRESEQRLADIIDFLPDATFVIDTKGKVIAWNRAIEEMTGVRKAEILGRDNYAYAVPFYGEPRPILIDLVFLEADEIERKYRFVTRRDKNIVGEAFTPALRGGKGAYLWGTASPLFDSTGALVGAIECIRDISDRKQAQEALLQSEQKLESIFEGLAIPAFVIAADHSVIYWNKALEQITGIRGKQILGTTRHWSVFYSKQRPCLSDFLVDGAKNAIDEWYGSKCCKSSLLYDAYEGTDFFPELSGGGRWLHFTAAPIKDVSGNLIGAVETIEDITERKQAETELRESEQRFADIIDFLPDATFAIDLDGKVIAWNRAIEELTGIPKKEILGKDHARIAQSFYGETRPLLVDLLFVDKKEYETRYSWVMRQKNCIVAEGPTPMVYGGRGAFLWGVAAPLYDTAGNVTGAIESVRDISERKQEQQGLIESRERLDLALKAASLGMWDWYIDTGKMVLNERWANILGYRLSEISPDFAAFEKMIHPEDAPGVFKALLAHLEGKTASYQSEYRLLTKSGDWIWVLDCGRVVERDTNGTPLRATGIVLDTNARKIAVEKLRLAYDEIREREEELQQANTELRDINLRLKESEQSLTMAIEISRASIWEYDVKTGQTHIKRLPGESRLGYSMEELSIKGEAFRDFYHPDSWRKAQDALDAYLRGETDTYETEICMRSKSGDWIWSYVLGKASEYANDGSPKKLLGIAIDITPIKKAQEEVKAAQEQLMQADKLVALGTLVAGVAHEINNPNNFVMLNTPLIQEVWKGLLPVLEQYYREQGDFKAGGMQYSKVREAVPTLLNGILDGARRISSIVRELKDFARPDDVTMNQKVDINAAVQAAVSLLHNAIKKATSSFTVTYSENLPQVSGNTQRLEQVFINLILNACQALPDNTRGIQVTTASDGESIAVTVKDEGRGIPREYLNQIMDPFFTTKRGAGGTGLGLSISRKIIDDHKGRIDVQSHEGTGTTFTVLLPVKRAEEGKRILIADDEESMREIMYNTLSRNPSYEVRTVENGTAACIMLGKWRPDLIVLDINMPDMNGVEVCRRIKDDPDFANTKVIICTGHPDSREMQDIREMGFADMLPKPFLNRELQGIIAAALTSKNDAS